MAKNWLRHRWPVLFGLLVLLAYLVAAITLLPRWIVSLTAGIADANTQLNAVTNTRGTLLGILTPVVIVVGGIVALLNYREVREQNQRTNDLGRKERDEMRRVRRAEVYAEFLRACDDCWDAANDLHHADRDEMDVDSFLTLLRANREKRATMDRSHNRVMLLGSDAAQASASDLMRHCGVAMVSKARPHRDCLRGCGSALR
jgi:hypothetical protein